MRTIHIVFDGPPGPESGRFVETEDGSGKGISVGWWEQHGDYWHLCIRDSTYDLGLVLKALMDLSRGSSHITDIAAAHITPDKFPPKIMALPAAAVMGLFESVMERVRRATPMTDARIRDIEAGLAQLMLERNAWSVATFGLADRRKGIVEHIRKELVEIEANPDDLTEWIDVILLALDGYFRSGGHDVLGDLNNKVAVNRSRKWPEDAPTDRAAEHIRDE